MTRCASPLMASTIATLAMMSTFGGARDVQAQGPPSPRPQPPRVQLLRWKLAPGETLRYTRTSRNEEKKEDGTTTRTSQSSTIELSWHVDSVAADGSARVTQRVDRVRQMLATPEGEVVYDSAEAEAPKGRATPLAVAVATLVGAECSFVLTPRGEVRELTLSDKTHARAMKEGVVGTVRRYEVLLGSSVPAATLPARPVEKGATWPEILRVQVSWDAREIVRTYRFSGPIERQGRTVEAITFETRTTRGPAFPTLGDPREPTRKDEWAGRGQLTFDDTAGRLLDREERSYLPWPGIESETGFSQFTELIETVTLKSDATDGRRK
jgi:hypothetical protein